MAGTIHWDALSFLRVDQVDPFSLVILNQPISIGKEIMTHLWNKSALRVTVDGGTDCWFEWLKNSSVGGIVNSGLPDLVTGDLDSIQSSTVAMLEEKSVPVVRTEDQDFTDFTKAIKSIKETQTPGLIVVICEVSGRLDQILSQLNTLHLFEEPIVLLSSCSATWLLKPGSHEINVSSLMNKDNDILSRDRWLGLIPVGAPTIVTTSGLKWNLNNQEMKFGGMVSSSNTYSNDPIIKIRADQPLIWSMGISIKN